MKNLLFNIKSVIKGSYKANVGAGAETKSFGSTTLVYSDESPLRAKKFDNIRITFRMCYI
jgi:hypothetical protein